MRTLVMKFGGAALSTPTRFSLTAQWIHKRLIEFPRIVVAVSAMGKTTDQLLMLSRKVHPSPPKREQDMLVTAGERVSMSLLAMALDLEGIDAISFTGSQSGILTSLDHGEAKILGVRPYRIEEALNVGQVVIVAGFQGVNEKKEVTTLGRGGSDTSAVALAVALGAEQVEFYKDVPGIGAEDPNGVPDTKIFKELSYEKAIKIAVQGARVLHARALQLAQKNRLPLEVRSFLKPEITGTRISSQMAPTNEPIFEEESVYG